MGLLHLLSQVFIYLFGLLYPSYHSFHYYYQIKRHPSLYDAEVVQELLQHYVVMSLSMLSFWFSDLFLFWLPFYEEVKFLFIVWLVLPTTLGTLVLYQRFLDPFLEQNKSHLDFFFHSLESTFFQRVFDLVQIVFRVSKDILYFLLLKSFLTQSNSPSTSAKLSPSPTIPSSTEKNSLYSSAWSMASSLASGFDTSYFKITHSSTPAPPPSSSSSFTSPSPPSTSRKSTSKLMATYYDSSMTSSSTKARRNKTKMQLEPILTSRN